MRAARVQALVGDVVAVAAFATIGRLSHDEDASPSGIAHTSWPFLAGLALGWALAAAGRRDPRALDGGLLVWAVTVAAGMVLRRVSGEGTAPAFVVVAAVTLALLLLGWRAVAAHRVTARG